MRNNKKSICVSFDDLKIDDEVIIFDHNHNAHGSSGVIYHLDIDTKIVSVVTNGMVDTWEGLADGLQKYI